MRRKTLADASAAALGEQEPGDEEVVRRRDLEVPGRARDDADRAAGPLHEPGIVGRLREDVVGDIEGALERGAPERLRRLDRPQARAVERPSHAMVGARLL